MNTEQLINHRGDKRCFAAAAKSGYSEAQMSVDTPIHQRIEFILSRFIAVLCCSEDQKKIVRKDMNVGPGH